MYKGDVDAIIKYGYSGVKLDGCGAEYDLFVGLQPPAATTTANTTAAATDLVPF